MGQMRADTIARNDAIFREANEEIRSKAEEYGVQDGVLPFLCECATPDCLEILRLGLDTYENVRSRPDRFVVAPGHEAAEGAGARVVDQGDAYTVVEKEPGLR